MNEEATSRGTTCPKCGKVVDANARFCKYCALDLTQSAQSAQTASAPSNLKPYLLGLAGQLEGRQIVLEDRVVVVGRDPDQCQIVLPQTVISKRHAAFEIDQNQTVTLADLAAKNSTFVNDQPVKRKVLRDGDRVGFGLGGIVALTFHAAAAAATQHQASHMSHRSVASASDGRNISRFEVSTAPNEPKPLAAQSAPPMPAAPVPSRGSVGTMILRAAQIPVIRLGRAPDNNFVLEAPSVSRYHAMLSYQDGADPVITDLGSTNGTYVNGDLLTEPRRLTSQDLIFLGGFLLHVDGRTIKQHDLSASSITARNLTKEINGKTILKDVSLAISPREFVGLMGPSGCGKSTLMDALNGLRPASAGQVYVNDLDLYSNFNAIRRSIGYVPQRDILHDALTVERTLHYVARLRLPVGTSADTMWASSMR